MFKESSEIVIIRLKKGGGGVFVTHAQCIIEMMNIQCCGTYL